MAFGLLISPPLCIMHQPPQKFSPLFCIKGLTICFNQTIRHRSGREGLSLLLLSGKTFAKKIN